MYETVQSIRSGGSQSCALFPTGVLFKERALQPRVDHRRRATGRYSWTAWFIWWAWWSLS